MVMEFKRLGFPRRTVGVASGNVLRQNACRCQQGKGANEREKQDADEEIHRRLAVLASM